MRLVHPRGARRRFTGIVVSLLLAAAAVPGTALAQGAAPSAATAAQKRDAQILYLKGAASFEAKRFAEAQKAFAASYAVVASPNSHLMLARSLIELGSLVEAYDALELTRAESAADPKYADTAEQAIAERTELQKRLAIVTVKLRGAEGAATLVVAGRDIPEPRRAQPIPAVPGRIEVVASDAAGHRATRQTTLAAGASAELELDLAPAKAAPVALAKPPGPAAPSIVGAPPPSSAGGDAAADRTSLMPFAIAAGGVGVAGMVVFTVAGLMNQSTFAGLEESCPGLRCAEDRQSDIDAGRTQQTLANVGLVVGLIGLGAGVTLFALDPGPAPARSSGVRPEPPAVGVGLGSITVRGGF